MIIIDANNLAGKLKILGEKNFDKKLRELIKKYYKGKKRKILLVFDSNEPMGDKTEDGNIISIFTPKDKYYKNADDKIVEILEGETSSLLPGYSSGGEEITVVTDDRDLIGRIEKIIEDTASKKIKLQKLAEFISNIKIKKEKNTENGNRGLGKDEIKRINEELLKIWK